MRRWMTVLTSPERREYLADTIESLRRAGALDVDAERVIFVDGDASGYAFEGWRVCRLAPGRLFTRAACFTVLYTAARAGADELLYFEDDIVLCRNAVPAMLELGCPDDLGFVSFCDIRQAAVADGITSAPKYDWEAVPGQGGHWGNQALLLPGRSLVRLLEDDELLEKPRNAPGTPRVALHKTTRASDIALGMLLGPYGIFAPSLVQHVGARSLVQEHQPPLEAHGRQAPSFPGVDFDALTLPLEQPARHEALPPPKACWLHDGVLHPDGEICPQVLY